MPSGEQVRANFWPEVDGPVHEILQQSTNASAFIRDALYALYQEWAVIPDPGKIYQVRTFLRYDRDKLLWDWLNTIPSRKLSHVIRGAVYYYCGLRKGPSQDPGRLAAEIVRAMQARGVGVLQAPAQEATDEVKKLLQDGILQSFGG